MANKRIKIPKYIRKKEIRIHKLIKEKEKLEKEIEEHLKKKGVDVDQLREEDCANFVDSIDYNISFIDENDLNYFYEKVQDDYLRR